MTVANDEAFCIELDGKAATTLPGERLLDTLLRNMIDTPFSCRGGVCHACLLRCTTGKVPALAQRGIAEDLARIGYLLPCQCVPESDMRLERPRARDFTVGCVTLETIDAGDDFVIVRFETARSVDWQVGDTLEIVDTDCSNTVAIRLDLTHVDTDICQMDALVHLPPTLVAPDWLRNRDAFGATFQVRNVSEAADTAAREPADLPAPPTDARLWQELGDGAKVRAVLLDFYFAVFRDALLAPYFQRVTEQRLVEKQYSFLRQLMTGEKVYFGDRPRNAHHWMVISPDLFAHRHRIMVDTMQKHGLTEGQIARWSRFELYYRAHIVKAQAWPRLVGGEAQPLHGYSVETLSAATVCDACGSEIESGTTVHYHNRLGSVYCSKCTPAANHAANGASSPGTR